MSTSDLQPHNTTLKAPAQGPDLVETPEDRVFCDGGRGALGHPRIWLDLGEAGSIVCPYCSRKFVKISAQLQHG